MAFDTLKDRAVILYFDGDKISSIPLFVHMQFHIHDDGELPNDVSWIWPKVVFTNPEVTTILGRVSYTDMKRDGEAAINSGLQIISNNPAQMAPPAAAATDSPAKSAAATPGGDPSAMAMVGTLVDLASFVGANALYIGLGLVGIVALLVVIVFQRRGKAK